MGTYDIVKIPCPMCGTRAEAQSKGGDCALVVYELSEAPSNVLGDVNRHAPFECENCCARFKIALAVSLTVILA